MFPYYNRYVKNSIHTNNTMRTLFLFPYCSETSSRTAAKQVVYTLRIPYINSFVPLLQQVNPGCQVSTAFRAVQVYAVRWARRETRGYPGREVHRVPGARTGYRESRGRRGVTGTQGSQAGRDYPAKMSVPSLAPGYQ